MSETWSATRTSISRLKAAWRDADEDTRWSLGFWAVGIAMMAVAIVAQFGWLGVLFCAGLLVWAAGTQGLSKT